MKDARDFKKKSHWLKLGEKFTEVETFKLRMQTDQKIFVSSDFVGFVALRMPHVKISQIRVESWPWRP